MGALLSRFRKEPTTEHKLERLEEKIKEIEEYAINTQARKKRFVGTFLAVAVGIYVTAVIASIYFVYFPRTWKQKIVYFVPLVIFPFLIILLRRLFTWYFQRKLNKNSAMLSKLRTEKKEILEQVMNKETYKVAVNLLERFGSDRSANKRLTMGVMSRPATPQLLNNSATSRSVAKPTTNQFGAGSIVQGNAQNCSLPTLKTSNVLATLNQSLSTTPIIRTDQQLRRRTPFPIINQSEKGLLERCLDILIGDGPLDRFAVICKECHCHNGMALKEEFEYVAFRCAFCNAMNPARKTRPIAPRLSLQATSHTRLPHSMLRNASSSDSSSEASDDDDSGYRRPYVQLRLSESTANQSESPEVTDTTSETANTKTAPSEVIESNPIEDNSEPMDIVENEDHALTSKPNVVVSEEEKKLN